MRYGLTLASETAGHAVPTGVTLLFTGIGVGLLVGGVMAVLIWLMNQP